MAKLLWFSKRRIASSRPPSCATFYPGKSTSHLALPSFDRQTKKKQSLDFFYVSLCLIRVGFGGLAFLNLSPSENAVDAYISRFQYLAQNNRSFSTALAIFMKT